MVRIGCFTKNANLSTVNNERMTLVTLIHDVLEFHKNRAPDIPLYPILQNTEWINLEDMNIDIEVKPVAKEIQQILFNSKA